jgi:hypothetical protein
MQAIQASKRRLWLSWAFGSASRLVQLGFDAKKLIKINVPPVLSRHTLTGAADVKRWLEHSGTNVCCVDVLTLGVHARKSWIFSRYAFGGSYQVGIIAVPETSFDPKYWLASRRGTWSVLRNLAGYVYYKFWILFKGKCSQNLTSSIFAPAAAGRYALLRSAIP